MDTASDTATFATLSRNVAAALGTNWYIANSWTGPNIQTAHLAAFRSVGITLTSSPGKTTVALDIPHSDENGAVDLPEDTTAVELAAIIRARVLPHLVNTQVHQASRRLAALLARTVVFTDEYRYTEVLWSHGNMLVHRTNLGINVSLGISAPLDAAIAAAAARMVPGIETCPDAAGPAARALADALPGLWQSDADVLEDESTVRTTFLRADDDTVFIDLGADADLDAMVRVAFAPSTTDQAEAVLRAYAGAAPQE